MTGSDGAWSLANVAAFVAATAGRPGRIEEVEGGLLVASPVPVANGYYNAAFPHDEVDPDPFLDRATAFFAERSSPFVLWVTEEAPQLIAAATARASTVLPEVLPQMVVRSPLPAVPGLRVTEATSDADRALFGDLCEESYGIAGLAWILEHHDALRAPGTIWAIVADESGPLGVGAGYGDGVTGGIYYVGTPARSGRKGAAGAVTTWLANRLFDLGAAEVTLQASRAGQPVYARLGFHHQVGIRRITLEPSAP